MITNELPWRSYFNETVKTKLKSEGIIHYALCYEKWPNFEVEYDFDGKSLIIHVSDYIFDMSAKCEEMFLMHIVQKATGCYMDLDWSKFNDRMDTYSEYFNVANKLFLKRNPSVKPIVSEEHILFTAIGDEMIHDEELPSDLNFFRMYLQESDSNKAYTFTTSLLRAIGINKKLDYPTTPVEVIKYLIFRGYHTVRRFDPDHQIDIDQIVKDYPHTEFAEKWLVENGYEI